MTIANNQGIRAMGKVCDLCDEPISHFAKRCDEHYRCDDCGTRERLCTYFEGVLCERCHRVRMDARIAAFAGDIKHTPEAVCPHCGYVMGDSWEYGEGRNNCPDCDNEFKLTRNTETTYSTEKTDAAE